jgi:biofilm protein TabA
MIVDTLQNVSHYSGLSERMAEAFKWLQDTNLASLSSGEHEISQGLRAIGQQYVTVPEAGRKYEAHRRFIDIQYVIRGVERMLVQPVTSLRADDPYDADKDVVFFQPTGPRSEIVLQEGMFAVFLPQDAHMPMLAAGSQTEVTKVVLKVAV